jgi:hypothetical protein
MNRKPATPPGIIQALLLSALFLAPLRAQTPTPADTPVGHWVAEHTSKGGIGSWWNFRPDGTLTMFIGAAVTSPITRFGDTFTEPSGTTTGAPVKVTFHVDGETLHLKSADTPDRTFTRVGPAPSATDPLLGKWKPNPSDTLSTDPNVAAQQKLLLNAIFAFAADNTQSVRIPFTSFEGTWDATAHTFHLKNQTTNFTFARTGTKLTLGQPPDGKMTDTYLPDPIL